MVKGPFTLKPKITTGAGDHFNSGFCLGKLLGFSTELCLLSGVATSVLFENPGWPHRNWITLELEGRTANRSAIGARVEIVAADSAGETRTVRRTVGTGGSFGSGSLQLHVGLGSAVRVPLVRVTWPDSMRSTTSYSNLEVRRTYHIIQGQSPRVLDRPPVPFRQGTVAANAHHR